jgi:DNA-binding transcriptional ArsR family regulator
MPRRNGSGLALLADPLRLRIVALLALGPRRPSVVADQLGISRSAATRYLRLLLEAGLVTRHQAMLDRRRFVYLISPARHGVVTAWLAGTRIGLDDPHPVFAIRLQALENALAKPDSEVVADNRNDVEN